MITLRFSRASPGPAPVPQDHGPGRRGRYRPQGDPPPGMVREGEELALPGAIRLSSGPSGPALPPASGAAARPAPEREPPAQALLLWAAPSHMTIGGSFDAVWTPGEGGSPGG